MKKILYFNYIDPKEKGVRKKIEFQKKAFKKNKYQINEIKIDLYKEKKALYYENEIILEDIIIRGNNIKEKIKKNIDWEKICVEIAKICTDRRFEIIYIRYPGSNRAFINLLKILNKKNIRIFLEIPTYPYDGETSKIHISKILDKIYRKLLYKYVEKIITYSEDKYIFKIPCINISNGVDLEEIKTIVPGLNQNKKIVFTSVSNCSFWHGIDRFLYSLDKYKKDNVIFNIVGNGEELKGLKEIVNKSLYLSKIVKFYGIKLNNELDEIYNQTNICVASLGRHRSGLSVMKALKNREYCAKGLPIIFSEDDPDFREISFVYKVTADEQLLDIEKIINWYKKLNIKSKDIREYSKVFSWDIQINKIVKQINQNRK